MLVYKNPGKHWGDIHVFDAIWNKELDAYVGQAEHTIFFSTQGDRPVADEIAKADFDGDLFWICSNTEVTKDIFLLFWVLIMFVFIVKLQKKFLLRFDGIGVFFIDK